MLLYLYDFFCFILLRKISKKQSLKEKESQRVFLLRFSEPQQAGTSFGIFEVKESDSSVKNLCGMDHIEEIGECVTERYIVIDTLLNKPLKKGDKYEVRIFKKNSAVKWNWLPWSDETMVFSGMSKELEY